MKEVTYRGHKYKSDGEKIWCDGVLLEMVVQKQIKSMEQITALKVDDYIFYKGEIYKRSESLIKK